MDADRCHVLKFPFVRRNEFVFYENIGFTQSDFFEIEDELKINVKNLFKINNDVDGIIHFTKGVSLFNGFYFSL